MPEILGLSLDPGAFSPLGLFLEADIVVKIVMVGLLLASIWTWMIIIGHGMKLRRLRRKSDKFESAFWDTDDVDKFYKANRDARLPIRKVLSAGLEEWRDSTKKPNYDREGLRQRLATAMNTTIADEVERLSDRLNFLATVGSVAPFIGLFGTVWGIMRSFSAIAAEQNSSLAVVAPGIAEALFATAIGLFAAIPAVIAYNRFAHRLNQMEAKLGRFADSFLSQLSREMER